MRKYLPIVILLGCAGLFVFGLNELFALRFETGDVYAPYSSLRADPLGAMAFYESLEKMPGIAVRRDFSEANRLPSDPQTVYLHLAAESREWRHVPVDLVQEIKSFLRRGGRLVITYYPQTTAPYHYYWDDDDSTNAVKTATNTNAPAVKLARKKKKSSATANQWVNLEQEWKFHEGFLELPQDGDQYAPVSVLNTSDLALPRTLAWHSGLIFTNCDSAWSTIYARGNHAVVLERNFGNGSVVLAGDSYFLSNEAMLKDRHADLLAWLIGANRNVVFDEAHLGVVESPGVAALMRKYRLHGVAAALLLLAGLFIWKNATSLVPPAAPQHRDDIVAGKDSGSGFVNLLRRNIPTQDILAVAFAEWKKSMRRSGKFSTARFQQAEAIFQADQALPPRERQPVSAYRQISKILDQRKPL